MLFIMKTPDGEQSIVINAKKLLPFLRFGETFCIIIYCMSALSLHTESTDSIIQTITLLCRLNRCLIDMHRLSANNDDMRPVHHTQARSHTGSRLHPTNLWSHPCICPHYRCLVCGVFKCPSRPKVTDL